ISEPIATASVSAPIPVQSPTASSTSDPTPASSPSITVSASSSSSTPATSAVTSDASKARANDIARRALAYLPELDQGMYMPISHEHVISIEKNMYVPLSHFLLKEISQAATDTNKQNWEIDANGKLSSTTAQINKITSFTDLDHAHNRGL